jgi:hypothetical protein
VLHTHLYFPLSVSFYQCSMLISIFPCQYHSTSAPYLSLFSPVNIILPALHTHLYLRIALTKMQKGRSLGNFRKGACFRD